MQAGELDEMQEARTAALALMGIKTGPLPGIYYDLAKCGVRVFKGAGTVQQAIQKMNALLCGAFFDPANGLSPTSSSSAGWTLNS